MSRINTTLLRKIVEIEKVVNWDTKTSGTCGLVNGPVGHLVGNHINNFYRVAENEDAIEYSLHGNHPVVFNNPGIRVANRASAKFRKAIEKVLVNHSNHVGLTLIQSC